MACNWICPVTRYLVMSPYKFLLPSDDCQCARDHIYWLVLVMELVYRFFEAVLVDLVNGRWRCWHMSGKCFCQNRSGTELRPKYRPGLKELMDKTYLFYVVPQFIAWVYTSSTYSAFHSRSPTRAVTGPVEIHAFSTWN
jgi:hypothetical protein